MTDTDAVQEFYPYERFPMTVIPLPRWHERVWCWWVGHTWMKFLWGGIHSMFDCDCCAVCRKFRGPLPADRDTEIYPCSMRR